METGSHFVSQKYYECPDSCVLSKVMNTRAMDTVSCIITFLVYSFKQISQRDLIFIFIIIN
jgi:hypothetical protein